MRTVYNSSNYGNDLRLTKADANKGSHAGQCDQDVKELKEKPYIKKQLTQLDPVKLTKELAEYGAWDKTELSDHEANIDRWLWISCSDIVEGK